MRALQLPATANKRARRCSSKYIYKHESIYTAGANFRTILSILKYTRSQFFDGIDKEKSFKNLK